MLRPRGPLPHGREIRTKGKLHRETARIAAGKRFSAESWPCDKCCCSRRAGDSRAWRTRRAGRERAPAVARGGRTNISHRSKWVPSEPKVRGPHQPTGQRETNKIFLALWTSIRVPCSNRESGPGRVARVDSRECWGEDLSRRQGSVVPTGTALLRQVGRVSPDSRRVGRDSDTV